MELSLIGLQNAGKTSLVNVLTTGTFHEDMMPTVGFNMRKVTKGGVTIKLWDLGGQVRAPAGTQCVRPLSAVVWFLRLPRLGRGARASTAPQPADSQEPRPALAAVPAQARFRSMWERYCRGVQAIVYVVDSADLDSVDTSRKELHELLGKPSLTGKETQCITLVRGTRGGALAREDGYAALQW